MGLVPNVLHNQTKARKGPSKTHPFLCFHNHQATNTTKESKPLQCCPTTCCLAWRHQTVKTRSFGPGVCCCKATKDSNHTSLENSFRVIHAWGYEIINEKTDVFAYGVLVLKFSSSLNVGCNPEETARTLAAAFMSIYHGSSSQPSMKSVVT